MSDKNKVKKKKPGQLSSGKFRKQVVVGFDENGKRIVKSFTAKTMWEAEKLADDYKARHGIGCAPEELTVAAAVERYINSRRDIIAPSTLNGYEIILKNRLQDIMMTKISELKILDVQAAVNKDFKEKKSSHKTLKSALSLINSALSVQGFEYHLVKKIKVPAPKAKKPELPSVEEVIKAIKGTGFELPCLIAMWLSLRVSEVRGLKYSDISEDGTTMTIMRTKVYVRGKDSFQDFTKNVRSNRTVLLPKYLYDLIKAQPHESDDEFIIKMTYNEVSQNFRRFMLKKGIKITFHQLRHLFATSAAMLGVGDDYIQKIGGWSSNTILKSVYTHTVPSVEKHFQSVINDYYLGIINGSEDDESGDDSSDEA